MIKLKEVIVLILALSTLIQSASAISNVQHSTDRNKVTLTYQGTPPFWINIRGDTHIGQNGGYLWAKTYSNSFTYDMSFAINPSKNFYYGVKDNSWSLTNQFNLMNQFKPSEVLTDISEETGKPDQHYCSYDESRNKITLIIKEGGIYDNSPVISKINQYFASVKNHLGIDNVGVKKFSGSSVAQFDEFIENLVIQENVGYIIFVGADLPIVLFGDIAETWLLLDHDTINDIYAYVNRTKQVGLNECVDVAISTIVAPQSYSNESKRSFIVSTLSNFINYHNNPALYYNKYNGILAIDWDNNLSGGIGFPVGGDLSPTRYTEYKKIYFYPVIYTLNSNYSRIYQNFAGNLLISYNVHGSPSMLGLGLSEPPAIEVNYDGIYTDLSELSLFVEKNDNPALFVNSYMACAQDVVSIIGDDSFCCWSQEWLDVGAWTMFTVNGAPYHHSFYRWLFLEKVVGKAIRKTYHSQDIIFGDILGTLP